MTQLVSLAVMATTFLIPAAYAAEPIHFKLWPAVADLGSRGNSPLTIYLAPKEKASGAAIIICPGGGYGRLSLKEEGHDVARWFSERGVAGIVLGYRMPDPSKEGKPLPLQDAQRAIRLVRSRAQEWGLRADRIGIMGFSAGGHLASTAGTHFDAGKPDATDPMDRLSCRPDFLALAYPVITFQDPYAHKGSRDAFLGKAPDPKLIELYSNDLQVTAQTPPTFLVHTRDDGLKIENSTRFHEALRKAGVASELRLFDKGGHGYGLGAPGTEAATWPERFMEWMSAQGFLKH